MRKFGNQSLTVGPQGSAGRRDAAPRSALAPGSERDLQIMAGASPLDAGGSGHVAFRGVPLSSVQEQRADWLDDARAEMESD